MFQDKNQPFGPINFLNTTSELNKFSYPPPRDPDKFSYLLVIHHVMQDKRYFYIIKNCGNLIIINDTIIIKQQISEKYLYA